MLNQLLGERSPDRRQALGTNSGVICRRSNQCQGTTGHNQINAHATATHLGDRYEAEAIHQVFGCVPVSSLKGHLGHSFAPCGTMESIATLAMLRSGTFWPTLNCKTPDPELPKLDYLMDPRSLECPVAMSNSFAMGGFNVALVLSA